MNIKFVVVIMHIKTSRCLTNDFVSKNRNKGMELLVGKDWRDYFDVVIVQARKPKFFTDESRPFRIYDFESKSQLWDRVNSLQKGNIYYEVNYHNLNVNIEYVLIFNF